MSLTAVHPGTSALGTLPLSSSVTRPQGTAHYSAQRNEVNGPISRFKIQKLQIPNFLTLKLSGVFTKQASGASETDFLRLYQWCGEEEERPDVPTETGSSPCSKLGGA